MTRCRCAGPFSGLAAALAFAVFLPAAAAAAPTTIQAIDLKAGWNAVFLLVQPEERDLAVVFKGAPVESVWAWLDRQSRVAFIQKTSELTVPRAGWQAWFAAPGQAMLSNLFLLQVNHAYLVKASAAATVTISGRPSARTAPWVPDSFNLVGFPVDPDAPPTFADWFAPSAAQRGQAVYRLRNQQWEFVDDPAGTVMAAGEAYWVWCEGGSSYAGPVQASLAFGDDGLAFGHSIEKLSLQVSNVTDLSQGYSLTMLPAANPPGLSWTDADPASGAPILRPLVELPSQTVGAHASASLGLTVRRETFTGTGEAVLDLRAGPGARILIPVTAER